MSRPFVVAGGIVRNRAWVLPTHLDAVARNKPRALFYLTGDNEDETETILNRASDRLDIPLDYYILHTKAPYGTRDGANGTGVRYNSAHMGMLRNRWWTEATARWPGATHFWVVDSDVIPDPDVLEKLLALDNDVAAAFVPIADGKTPIAMIGWDGMNPRRSGEEIHLRKPHAASMIGACYLIRAGKHSPLRDVTWWGEHPQGEDGVFALACRERGIVMMHHPGAKCLHLMKGPNQ